MQRVSCSLQTKPAQNTKRKPQMENQTPHNQHQYTTPLTISSIPLPSQHTPGPWLEIALQGQSQTLQMMIGPSLSSNQHPKPQYLERLATHPLHQDPPNFGHQLWMSMFLQAQYTGTQQPLSIEEINSLMGQLCQTMLFFSLMDLEAPIPSPAFILWPLVEQIPPPPPNFLSPLE